MGTVLNDEMNTYDSHRQELLGRAKGKFVLIRKDRLVDVFTSVEDAIRRGYSEFGNTPFLVKEIVETEIPLHFTSFLIQV